MRACARAFADAKPCDVWERMMTRALRYLGHAAVSGTLGWLALMVAFEVAYRVECRVRRR
jgi:hypothetical protein